MIKNLVQVVESRFTNERMAALAATLKEVAARAPADYLINPAFVSLRNNSHYSHLECQDQWDMVRSHTVLAWSHYLPKKSLLVGGGEWW